MASTAAAVSSTDRLSHLSDDILTHILSFAPSPEAARATALSRRWRRPLWLNTGAVNIDYRSYSTAGGTVNRRRLVDDADHAYACLSSHGGVPKKLSIVLRDDAIVCAACDNEDDEHDSDVSAGVEEVGDVDDARLEWVNNGGLPRCTLPFAVLRVLELTGYDLKPYTAHRRQLAFPRLEAMRLRRCRTELDTLQGMITAAPRLADIRLESLRFVDIDFVYILRCEAATVIGMENCRILYDDLHHGGCRVMLYAPRLRRFRYTQTRPVDNDTRFSFHNYYDVPPHLEHVHVEVHSSSEPVLHSVLCTVSSVRSLKITAYSISDLDFGAPFFRNLERLQIEDLSGWCVRSHVAAASAMTSLLQQCPCLRDLVLKFSWRKYLRDIKADAADEMAAVADFSPCRSMDVGHEDDDEAECCDSLQDIDGQLCCGLSGKLGCLKKVVVVFEAQELTCFQVRLVKFLAKSALGLEEFVVDGGKGYDSSRINQKVVRWQKLRRPPPRSLPPASPPPPPLSEFPPLEASSFSSDDGEIYDNDMPEVKEYVYSNYLHTSDEDDDDDDDDDISPRHYFHSGRKKKKGASPECFGVKFKGPIMSRLKRQQAISHRRRRQYRHRSDREEQKSSQDDSVLAAEPRPVSGSTTAATPERWSAPLIYEFPLLRRRVPPPAPHMPVIRRAPPAAVPTHSSPPEAPQVNPATPLAPMCSTDDTSSRVWRAVRLTDLGVDFTASRRFSHHLPPRRRQPSSPATSRCRFATFPGRPSSRTKWRR